MKLRKADGTAEREVLTGMIVSDAVLGRVAARWDGSGLFPSRYSNLIGSWAVDFYRKHRKAPGRAIQSLFAEWAEQQGRDDDAVARLVERYLETLSDAYESAGELNVDHVVDLAGKLFREVRLRKLSGDVVADLDAAKHDRAEQHVIGYTPVALGAGAGTDLFQDEEAVANVFREDRAEPLVEYPGALGRFFGPTLSRNCFVSFMGPEGSGKSYWLHDIAYRGMLARHRVAFFDVGDMTEDQVAERFLVRASGRPLRSSDGRWPVEVNWPADLKSGFPVPDVEFETQSFEKPLTRTVAWEACQRVMREQVKSKKSYLRLCCKANSTATIADVRSVLRGWELAGWVADIVVIDYADILAPLNRRAERRDQVNDTWKALRALSQELHVLVVTATQANRQSYNSPTVRMEHTGEDKRKNAEVTAMWGISQTAEEKRLQLQRLNWVKRRTGDSTKYEQVFVANCRALGHPVVKSCFPAKRPAGEESGGDGEPRARRPKRRQSD